MERKIVKEVLKHYNDAAEEWMDWKCEEAAVRLARYEEEMRDPAVQKLVQKNRDMIWESEVIIDED